MADHLFFHSPCFDGFVSAAIASEFLEQRRGWRNLRLHPVGYEYRHRWLRSVRVVRFAVVDFLFHPRAQFWADHHTTTFLTAALERQFHEQANKYLVFDPTAGSCAELLSAELKGRFGFTCDRLDDAVRWAAKIDAARYESVDEAIHPQSPAQKLALATTVDWTPELSRHVVGWLRTETLAHILDRPEIAKRVTRACAKVESGLRVFRASAHVENGIVVFDVNPGNTVVSRYAPYYFYPDARYSAGILRVPGAAKITVMRNPWRDFKSVYLGEILKIHGGGGHERVASALLRGKRARNARLVLEDVVGQIRKREAAADDGSSYDRAPQLL
jgi:hypothetical protein